MRARASPLRRTAELPEKLKCDLAGPLSYFDGSEDLSTRSEAVAGVLVRAHEVMAVRRGASRARQIAQAFAWHQEEPEIGIPALLNAGDPRTVAASRSYSVDDFWGHGSFLCL